MSAESPPQLITHCTPSLGVVSAILVNSGDRVKKDQALFIIEAMKVQSTVLAECAGIVGKILVDESAEVFVGQPLIDIEYTGASSEAEQLNEDKATEPEVADNLSPHLQQLNIRKHRQARRIQNLQA